MFFLPFNILTLFYLFLARKLGMKDEKYYKELGATSACAIWSVEEIMQVKEVRALLIEDMQFSSARAATVAAKRDADIVY